MAQGAAARNASSPSVTPQPLEKRVFFSADPAIVTVNWNGHALRAIDGQYVALTKDGADFGKLAKRAGFTDVRTLSADGFYAFDTAMTPEQVKAWAKKHKSKLEDVHPDFVFDFAQAPQATPNDPLYPGQWHLNNTGSSSDPQQVVPDTGLVPMSSGLDYNGNIAAPGTPDADIDAPEAWAALNATGRTGKRSVVAVLDSGVDLTHPDLINNIFTNPRESTGTGGVDDDNNGFPDDLQGWDFFRRDNNPDDEVGHGTFVAGVVAAEENNNVGVAGVAHNTTDILPLKVGGQMNGQDVVSTSAVLDAINYATAMKRLWQASGGEQGANVIVMNGSITTSQFFFDRISSRAIARAGDADILFVVAAGNNAIDTSGFPQDFPKRFALNLDNVINVAATDKNDQLASFSNFGASAQVAAPGADILSTTLGGDFGYNSGTSFASPAVAGVIALAYAANPALDAAQLKQALFTGVDQLPSLGSQYNTPSLVTTKGRVNAYKTVRAALNTFVQNDDVRRGNWQGIYGKQGQYIVGDSPVAPSFVNVDFDNNAQFVPVTFTTDPRALQRTSDPSARLVGYLQNETQLNFALRFNDNQTHRVSFYAVDFENAGRRMAVEIVDATTGDLLHGQIVSDFKNGRYLTYDLTGDVNIRITKQAGPDAVISGIFFDPAPALQSSFAGTDGETRGNYTPVYGSEGFYVPGDRNTLPSTAGLTTSGATEQVVKGNTKDARALDNSRNASKNTLSYLTAPSTFDINLRFTDAGTGQPDRFTSHRVTLYMVDFERAGRAQRIELFDANTGQLLDQRDVTDFRNGTYLTWDVRDAVTFRVTKLAGTNAVVSGVFLDASPGNPVVYVGEDRDTKGSWKGTYGAAGAYVVADTNYTPNFLGGAGNIGGDPLTSGPDLRLSLSAGGVQRILDPHTGAKAALQRVSRPGDRTQAYFQGARFSVDLNFSDLNPHRVSIYMADYDKKKRVQTVTLVDPATGKVLSSRLVSDFKNGTYVTWDVIGPVRVVFQRVSGPNAVMSGVFFD